MNYKYRLHYLLRQLSYEDYQIAMKWFPARLGIHKKTFESWIFIKQGDPREIPASAFFILSLFFDVHPALLYSNPIKKKSIGESFQAFKLDCQNSISSVQLRLDLPEKETVIIDNFKSVIQ